MSCQCPPQSRWAALALAQGDEVGRQSPSILNQMHPSKCACTPCSLNHAIHALLKAPSCWNVSGIHRKGAAAASRQVLLFIKDMSEKWIHQSQEQFSETARLAPLSTHMGNLFLPGPGIAIGEVTSMRQLAGRAGGRVRRSLPQDSMRKRCTGTWVSSLTRPWSGMERRSGSLIPTSQKC